MAIKRNQKNQFQKIVGLIWSIVRRFNSRGYEQEDLYQIGCIGFIKAIKRFDTDFDVRLSTYAVPYMLGEIKRFIRDDGPIKVSRSLKELYVKIKELQRESISKKGREMSLEELEKELKISKEDINLALEITNQIDSIEESKYTDYKDGNSISLIETLSNGKNEAEDSTNKMFVRDMISKLEKKEKEVIMLRFFKEKTQSEVGRILGITQVQVSRIERKVLDSMKRQMLYS